MNIWFLKGTSASGKTFWSNIIKQETNATWLSSDDIAENVLGIVNGFNGAKVFAERDKQAFEALASGKDIILDSTNLGYKKQVMWMNAKKKYNANLICVYFNLCLNDMKHNCIERQKGKWNNKTLDEIWDIVNLQKLSLVAPDLNNFDSVINITHNLSEIEIKKIIQDEQNKFNK